MYSHLTASGSTGSNLQKGLIATALITVNTALTGTITVSDETGTAGTPVVASIVNPTVGTSFEYWDLKKGLTVQSNATCDLTVNTYSGRG
jgi:hypothetical protein